MLRHREDIATILLSLAPNVQPKFAHLVVWVGQLDNAVDLVVHIICFFDASQLGFSVTLGDEDIFEFLVVEDTR